MHAHSRSPGEGDLSKDSKEAREGAQQVLGATQCRYWSPAKRGPEHCPPVCLYWRLVLQCRLLGPIRDLLHQNHFTEPRHLHFEQAPTKVGEQSQAGCSQTIGGFGPCFCLPAPRKGRTGAARGKHTLMGQFYLPEHFDMSSRVAFTSPSVR